MFRKRRGAEDMGLGKTRRALRSMGVNVLEAIVGGVDAQWEICEMGWMCR